MSVEGIKYYGINPYDAQMRVRCPAVKKKQNKTPIERKIGISALGTFAVLYLAITGFVLSKKISQHKLQKSLSEIFNREFSANETRQIQDRYAKIFKINDAEEFTKKAFEQIKKDYGYENADLKLKINYQKRTLLDVLKNPKKRVVDGQHRNFDLLTIINLNCNKGDKLNCFTKTSILNTLFHELKHLQQSHICYLGDKEKYFNYFKEKRILPLNEKSELINKLENNYTNAFKNVPASNIKVSKEKVNQYIECYKSYKTNIPLKEYKKQLLEIEAFHAGDTAEKMAFNNIPAPKLPTGPLTKILLGTSLGCFAIDGYKTYSQNNNQ